MYAVCRNRSVTKDFFRITLYFAAHALKAHPQSPVGSVVNNLAALSPKQPLLGNKNVCLRYLQ